MKKSFQTLILACAALFSAREFPAHAAVIHYVAHDLADVVPGEDLWRYEYTVSGEFFAQFEFFEIYFDASLFASLAAGANPDPAWDALILQQPNPGNPAPFDAGIYNAFALQDNPSLKGEGIV
ncbi:MAG TPA: hypothetical protein DEH78_24760, partial [Solibacterales bacterium]|nr:hypothetical protein [Bryobacterales bacterium]